MAPDEILSKYGLSKWRIFVFNLIPFASYLSFGSGSTTLLDFTPHFTPTCKNTNTALYGAFTADIPTFTLEQMDTTDEKNEIKES